MQRALLVILLAATLAIFGCAQQSPPVLQPLPVPRCAAAVDHAEPTRTIDELKRVFGCNSPRLSARYKEALKSNPGLGGRALFEVRIEPSGRVSSCSVVSSTFESPELVQALAHEIKTFDFGAKEVGPFVISFPVEFHPE
jgi:TonB family protein